MPAERTKPERIQVALTEQLRAVVDRTRDLTSSPGVGPTISLMLSTHTELMRLELRRIPFTVEEANALAAIVAGPLVIPRVGNLLIGEVMDAFDIAGDDESSYAAQFGIDEAVLLDKLRGIGPSADLALRLAFATWWSMPAAERDYLDVGLRITDGRFIEEGPWLSGPQAGPPRTLRILINQLGVDDAPDDVRAAAIAEWLTQNTPAPRLAAELRAAGLSEGHPGGGE